MGRTKTKSFLKRKKVPKFYFHFGQPKKCLPFFFYTAVCLGVSSQIKLLKKNEQTIFYVVDKQVIHVFLGQILILASHTFNDKIFKGLLVWFSV